DFHVTGVQTCALPIYTDNTAISGETIDYGPCAMMSRYSPDTVFSSIDSQGRYRFGNQAAIAQWNMARFAECLLPLLDADESVARSEERPCRERVESAV